MGILSQANDTRSYAREPSLLCLYVLETKMPQVASLQT